MGGCAVRSKTNTDPVFVRTVKTQMSDEYAMDVEGCLWYN